MNWKNIFIVRLKKLRDSLRNRHTLISAIVLPAIVMSVLFLGMGQIMTKVLTTAREEDPVVMVGLWPLFGAGPLHFMFIQ